MRLLIEVFITASGDTKVYCAQVFRIWVSFVPIEWQYIFFNNMIGYIILIFVSYTGNGNVAQLIRPIEVYNGLIKGIHDYFNNTCIILLHATPNPVEGQGKYFIEKRIVSTNFYMDACKICTRRMHYWNFKGIWADPCTHVQRIWISRHLKNGLVHFQSFCELIKFTIFTL